MSQDLRLLCGGFGRKQTYRCTPSLDKFVHITTVIQQKTDYLEVAVFLCDSSMQRRAFVADDIHVCSSLAQQAHSL